LENDVDLLLDFSAANLAKELEQLVYDVATGKKTPRTQTLRNFAFQITRGLNGISL
jgi:hypothetical protein